MGIILLTAAQQMQLHHFVVVIRLSNIVTNVRNGMTECLIAGKSCSVPQTNIQNVQAHLIPSYDKHT